MIYEFYGEECPHCITMKPLVDKLRLEGVLVEQFEVWHNDNNAHKLHQYDDGSKCGGVPFFVNPETKKFICGEASYEELKALAG